MFQKNEQINVVSKELLDSVNVLNFAVNELHNVSSTINETLESFVNEVRNLDVNGTLVYTTADSIMNISSNVTAYSNLTEREILFLNTTVELMDKYISGFEQIDIVSRGQRVIEIGEKDLGGLPQKDVEKYKSELVKIGQELVDAGGEDASLILEDMITFRNALANGSILKEYIKLNKTNYLNESTISQKANNSVHIPFDTFVKQRISEMLNKTVEIYRNSSLANSVRLVERAASGLESVLDSFDLDKAVKTYTIIEQEKELDRGYVQINNIETFANAIKNIANGTAVNDSDLTDLIDEIKPVETLTNVVFDSMISTAQSLYKEKITEHGENADMIYIEVNGVSLDKINKVRNNGTFEQKLEVFKNIVDMHSRTAKNTGFIDLDISYKVLREEA